MDKTAKKVAERYVSRTAAWENLPKGWTQESVKKMWDSLTGDRKHKVTACIKKMDGKVSDAGAFCASLADKMEPGWRSKDASDIVAERYMQALSRPAAKGRPALEALSDAWDSYEDLYYDRVEGFFDDTAMQDIDDIAIDDSMSLQQAEKLLNAAEQLYKAFKREDRQTYKWRAAFNWLLEGKDINVPRMTKDVEGTLALLKNRHSKIEGLATRYKREAPHIDLGLSASRALEASTKTIQAFDKAVKLLKAGQL